MSLHEQMAQGINQAALRRGHATEWQRHLSGEASHLLHGADDEDAVDHDERADEEVERDRRVAVSPQESHQEPKAKEDHDFHVEKPLVVQRHFLAAQHTGIISAFGLKQRRR